MWEILQEVFHRSLLGIEVWQYLASLGAIFAGFVLKKISVAVTKRLSKATEGGRFRLDDILFEALAGPVGWAFLAGGIYIALSALPIPEEPLNIQRFVDALAKGVGLVLLAWFLVRFIDGLADEWAKGAAETETKIDDQVVPLIRKSVKVFVIVITVVMVLQALGYSVSGLIAGVGLGGAAFALASKDTVANLFGSIVVFVDQPFHIGDWIEIGDIEGTVEDVGLRTTKIRTFANSLITLPNATFTTNSVNNWSWMKKRRIKTTIGLTYDTPPEKMAQAVEAVRKVLREDNRIHQDFFLVNFTDLSAYSLDIFIYTFTVTIAWAEHLQVRQEVLLKIIKAINDLGLEFAFPTQTIHMPPINGAPEHMKRELPA